MMSEIKQQSKFNSGHLKQFWTLVVKYLKVNIREKENLFWIFGYPHSRQANQLKGTRKANIECRISNVECRRNVFYLLYKKN